MQAVCRRSLALAVLALALTMAAPPAGAVSSSPRHWHWAKLRLHVVRWTPHVIAVKVTRKTAARGTVTVIAQGGGVQYTFRGPLSVRRSGRLSIATYEKRLDTGPYDITVRFAARPGWHPQVVTRHIRIG